MEEIKTAQEFDYINTKAWYCVKTQNRKEDEVKKSLDQRRETMEIEDQLLRVVVPYTEEETTKNGKITTVKKRMFPGYVFVEMYMTDRAWYVVRNTKYVHGFIGSHGHGAKPTPLLDSDMLTVLRRCGEVDSGELNFQVGQEVKIISGPFAGQKSTIKSIIGDKAKITIQLLNQINEVEINLIDLEG